MADGNLAGDSDGDRPRFFKIIHSTVIQESRLELPKKFVNKLGQDISDVAVLNVRNGTAWDIELKKADGAVWFQNGLQDFTEHHSICAGHFLVFRYDGISSDGKSQFHVLMFDMSGVEVGRRRICNDCDEQNNERTCRLPIGDVGEKSADTQRVSSGHSVPTTDKDRDGAAKDAIRFESENPFFISVMKQAYLSHKFMHIPCNFTREYLPDDLPKVKLQSPDGRLWKVRCLPSRKAIRMSKGFSAFVNATNLQVGNVCVFELIKVKDDPVMKVHIFPASGRLEKP
ncbi:hypothetical protein Scep_016016 [Stephania cephalantha]|uniref:TF-B3 domain-containing protein n=1 Tax=Stephania cephalantha TaxID=152367 RepID=A0AAP0NST8_9MAGN